MIEAIYGILESVGFTHPLHPAATHIPMGMVMGCFFFGIVSLTITKYDLRKTSLHCSVLAIIFVIPTVIAGIMDWQYFYGGTWQPLIIIKFILATILLILLAISIKMNLGQSTWKNLFIIYALCLACVTGLGFSGGELVYGG